MTGDAIVAALGERVLVSLLGSDGQRLTPWQELGVVGDGFSITFDDDDLTPAFDATALASPTVMAGPLLLTPGYHAAADLARVLRIPRSYLRRRGVTDQPSRLSIDGNEYRRRRRARARRGKR